MPDWRLGRLRLGFRLRNGGLYAGAQLYQGHFTHEVWVMVLCCVPLIVLATVVGGKLAKRISQERFLKLTYVLLLVIGTVLLVTS